MNNEEIAKVCHEVNRVYCVAIGDRSNEPWERAPEWQRKSAINGVKFHQDNPDASVSQSHESWLKEKETEGWSYGNVKNAGKKEHPCFVPFKKLPKEQKAKDFIFRELVHLLSNRNDKKVE